MSHSLHACLLVCAESARRSARGRSSPRPRTRSPRSTVRAATGRPGRRGIPQRACMHRVRGMTSRRALLTCPSALVCIHNLMRNCGAHQRTRRLRFPAPSVLTVLALFPRCFLLRSPVPSSLLSSQTCGRSITRASRTTPRRPTSRPSPCDAASPLVVGRTPPISRRSSLRRYTRRPELDRVDRAYRRTSRAA
jgi:hypothetical protein